VACPYAKKIRGTVAFCSIINKKVSTLRYPCRGNYKRCPIYVRYRARAAAPSAAPAEETPQAQPAQPSQAPAKRTPAPAAPTPAPAGGPSVKPSKSLCDSLILAALITSARATDRFTGPLRDAVRVLADKTRGNNKLLFFVGQVGGMSVRMLAHKGVVVYAFERGGSPLCESSAAEAFEQNSEARVDGILYEIKWEDIPLWRDSIIKEFS